MITKAFLSQLALLVFWGIFSRRCRGIGASGGSFICERGGFAYWCLQSIYYLNSKDNSRFVENASLSRHKQMSPNSGRKENFQKSHAIRSIQSEDGDIIDCIQIYKQPSLDHPSLRNHKIQLTPSYDLTMEMAATRKSKKSFTERNRGSPETVTTQLWQRSGSCPEGTIAIRRIDKNNGTKGDIVENYGRKKPVSFHHNKQLNESKMLYLLQTNHSMAILLTAGYAYLGAKGDIKVCYPQVELDDEYSTSRVALNSGPQYEYEVIESGWAVNPSVYRDRQTRLFVYWTVGTHPHTATGMGSGKFSDYITESSGYIKRMRILGNNLELKIPEWIYTYSDEYDCYDVFYLGDYVEDPEFYYGGPGRNPKCP